MTEIIRGTTPSIQYTYRTVNVANITVAVLTIKQGDTLLVEKDLSTATVAQKTITWTLTQENTLLMKPGDVTVMVNWLLNDGTRGASRKKTYGVLDNDKNEVI